MSHADIAWMFVSTALVLLMTPALGFFYGGMVRSKNALNTLMMSFSALGPVAVVWALLGYSLAFAPGTPFAGSTGFVALRGVGLEAQGTIPHLLFMAYQGTFAIITAALISGAVVERLRFSAYLAFVVVWVLTVYAPVAHWVWGGGFLSTAGALDFAGGAVVHVNAAAAALVAAMVVGPRKDYGRRAMLPHNVPFTLLGAGLLWFGWFGFNAGSALAANAVAALAFVNTLLAPAAALAMWTVLDLVREGRATAVGAATAIVVGLVAVTPAAGYVAPASALMLGALAAVPSYFALIWRARTTLDDSLDVVAAHGLGGATGALLSRGLRGPAVERRPGRPGGGPRRAAGNAAAQRRGRGRLQRRAATFGILKLLALVMPLRIAGRVEGIGLTSPSTAKRPTPPATARSSSRLARSASPGSPSRCPWPMEDVRETHCRNRQAGETERRARGALPCRGPRPHHQPRAGARRRDGACRELPGDHRQDGAGREGAAGDRRLQPLRRADGPGHPGCGPHRRRRRRQGAGAAHREDLPDPLRRGRPGRRDADSARLSTSSCF
ncbi:MAG: ammonium transporter [Vicinamibacterales bacterium]